MVYALEIKADWEIKIADLDSDAQDLGKVVRY